MKSIGSPTPPLPRLTPNVVVLGFGIRKLWNVKKTVGLLHKYVNSFRKSNRHVAFIWLETRLQSTRLGP